MKLCECGRFRGAGKHECYFVTQEDWVRATASHRAIARLPEATFVRSVRHAWDLAIDESARREVDAEFPETVDA